MPGLPMLTDDHLAAIEERARLWEHYGDPSALDPADVLRLVGEIRGLNALARHVTSMYRQARDAQARAEDQLAARRVAEAVPPGEFATPEQLAGPPDA